MVEAIFRLAVKNHCSEICIKISSIAVNFLFNLQLYLSEGPKFFIHTLVIGTVSFKVSPTILKSIVYLIENT
jgi:hypothetical protein